MAIHLKHSIPNEPWDTATLIKTLPDNELVGLCRSAIDVPVRASDIPTGVPEPDLHQVATLVAEIGSRVVRGSLEAEVPEVMGAAEAAEALGVAQPNLRTINGLPQPIAKVRATTLWRATDIRKFAAQRKRG